ncbi:fimbria/pilus outer membrane usher protein [Citrobacter werkmanii]|uniref:fimbria/pilus outer membrane usher protein n=1 Tax=Citrobacter werkmanii TaxID=67827 RepID=UPI0037C5E638
MNDLSRAVRLRSFKLKTLACFVCLMVQSIHHAYAQDDFDMAALETSGPKVHVDLTQFSNQGSQLPGKYHVDVFVDHEQVDTRDLVFTQDKKGQLTPTLTPELLKQWGVEIDNIPGLSAMKQITNLTETIPDSSAKLDFSQMRLDLTIPQADIDTAAQGYVSPTLWDEGIPALLVGYDFNGSNTWRTDDDSASGREDSYFLNLHSGLNLGAWRLRNYSTWSYTSYPESSGSSQENGGQDSDNTQSDWNSINTFLQRDIKSIHGLLTMGDTTTTSDVYDGFTFRGIQVSSDDDMLPDSLRNFAPTVRGIASSNATVTIRQNNTVIYQKQVPPGAFEIKDLYPNSTNGDLEVTVKESDGREHIFVQPFSSVAIMQREGHLKYALTGGEYRSNADGEEPDFAQMTMVYGLPHSMTVYGGTQLSDDYQNGLGGLGFTLGDVGSVSMDVAYSSADLYTGEHKTGESYRAQYSKSVLSTGSTLTLAAYRYSTKGYYSFQDAADLRTDDSYTDDENENNDFNLRNNKRSRWQASLTQTLPEGWGSLYANGYQQDYWNENGFERSLSVGYNNDFNGVTYSLTYNFTSMPEQENDHQLALDFSVPLNKLLPNSYVGYNMNTNRHGDTTQQVSLYGTALQHDNLSYSVTEGYNNHANAGSNGALTLDYTGSDGEANIGYNYDPDSHQINYGINGGVVVHQHGVTLSQALNQDIQSIALVRAQGVSNTEINNGTGLHTDWRGYAVVPYLTPYRRTTVRLDTGTLEDDADVETTTAEVVPTEGAVVMANFKTHIGARALIHLQHKGKNIPFGTTASLLNGNSSTGIVGDNGEVYLTGLPAQGDILAQWGKDKSSQCHAQYLLPDNKTTNGVVELTAVCS